MEVSSTEARHVTELALSLKNLSFLLSSAATNEHVLDADNLTNSLFVLHRQVDTMSSQLMEFNERCRVCVHGFANAPDGVIVGSAVGASEDPFPGFDRRTGHGEAPRASAVRRDKP